MAGLRKTIYVSSEELWDRVVGLAKKGDKTVSQFLLDSVGNSYLDRIESKLDLLIRGSSVFIEESGVIPNDVYEKIEPRKGASEILDSMKPTNPVKPDKVILEELCEKVTEEKLVEKATRLKEAKGVPVFGYPKSYQARK